MNSVKNGINKLGITGKVNDKTLKQFLLTEYFTYA